VSSIAELEKGIEWLQQQLAKDPAKVAVAGAHAYDAVARARLDGDEASANKH
jgi:hypothetical protein